MALSSESLAPPGSAPGEFPAPRLVRVDDPEELGRVYALLGPLCRPASAGDAEAGAEAGAGDPQVFRVHNEALALAFRMCQHNFRRERAAADAVWVFHATRRQATGFIVQSGFNAHYAGKSHGTALGPGIYVSLTPGLASGYATADARSARCMFVCEALPGAEKTHHKRSGEQIVLFREQQVAPRYLVYY